MIIKFEVPKGKLSLPHDAMAAIHNLNEKYDILVSVSPIFKERTKEQNAYFHSTLKKICRETGADIDQLKDTIKEKAMEIGYPAMERNGDYVLRKDGSMIPESTTKVSISDMKLLIETLYLWCFEHDIYIEKEEL